MSILSTNNALGASDLSVYVTDPIQQQFQALEDALQSALDRIEDAAGGVTYQSKPLNEISNERPNTGNINMNGK